MFQKNAETSSWDGFCKPDFEKKIVVCRLTTSATAGTVAVERKVGVVKPER